MQIKTVNDYGIIKNPRLNALIYAVLVFVSNHLTDAENNGCSNTYKILHGHADFTDADTSVNSSVPVTCEAGYEIHGPKYITCLQDGYWSDTNCVAKDCKKLAALAHGAVSYSNDRTTYGEVATFACDVGYYLSHNRTRVCGASGNWDGTTPDCIIQDCGVVTVPHHGTVAYSDDRTTHREEAIFTCDVGYHLSHSRTRTCDASGHWTGTTPYCIIQDCNILTAPLYGSVTYSNGRTTYGEEATFTCDVGYQLSHNRTRNCDASGNWKGATPYCIVQECDSIPAPLHGDVSYSNDLRRYQEVAKFTCDHGYYLSHSGTMICGAHAEWEGTIPTCHIIDCGIIRSPLHGSVSYSNGRTTYEEVATFTCDLGYYKSHDAKRTCGADWRWTGSTPHCMLIDCGVIVAPLHGAVKFSNDRTTYPEVASFTCDIGYVLSHGGARACVASGNWEGTTPHCVIIDCGVIPAPDHGSVLYSNNRTTYQEVATFTCDPGYHLMQYVKKACGASGYWSGTITPHCLITDCGEFPAPVHGKVSYSNERTTYQEVATFTCDFGYYLSHIRNRTCGATGRWGGTTPKCFVRECDDIPAPLHGTVAYSNNRKTYQEVATFTCDPGYHLSDNNQMICDGTGHWTGSKPDCLIKDCGDIPAPINGAVSFSNNRTAYQEVASFTCNLGYYLSDDLLMTCEASGNWGGSIPECFIKDCGDLPAPMHGSVSFTNNHTTYQELATFTCDLGYYLSPVETMICEASGKWNGSTPDCYIKDCGSNHTIPNGYFEFFGENTTFNSTFKVICNPGYEVHGDPTITCLHHGLWSNRTACYIKDCGKDVIIEHGEVSFDGRATTFNETIRVTCHRGYKLQGGDHITCLPEGIWSTTSKCIIRDCGNIYVMEHGIANFTGKKTTFNQSVSVNCDIGYEIHGNDHITCLPDGVWSNDSACHIKACGNKYVMEHGIANFTGKKTTFNQSVPVNCDIGYEIRGNDHITCLPNGVWSSDSACHIKDCGSNMSIDFGYASFKDRNTTYNQTVPVVCSDGYELHGDPFIICLQDGSWSNSSSCIAKDTIVKYLVPILAGAIPFCLVMSIAGGILCIYLKRKRTRGILNEEEGPSFEQFDMDYKNWREFRPGPINLVDFASYVDKMHENSNLLFADGFRNLEEESPIHPRAVAEMETSRQKSRYTDILPFDHSRVKLIPFDDDEGSDFINASYIPGYTLRREYIVTQGPMPSTKDNFWQMVWEQKVDIIVMLTKCVERGRVNHYCVDE